VAHNVSPNNAAPRNAKNESSFLRCGALNDCNNFLSKKGVSLFGVLAAAAVAYVNRTKSSTVNPA
jgi:hypothetical protein